MSGDLFWERSVRFGFLDRTDLAELARASAETGDWSVHEMRRTDGLPPAIRAALYTSRFPALYVGSLRRGGVFLRWRSNQATLRASLAARGHYFFGTAPGSDQVAMDGTLTHFVPSPVLNRYFITLLAELDRHGIETWFVAMPVNEATSAAIRPHVLADFRAYLAARLQAHPRFRLVGPVVPVWQNRWFGDGFSHLNPAGAERYTRWLAACLRDTTGVACDAPPDRDGERLLSAAGAPSGS